MEKKVPQNFWTELSEKEQYQLYQVSRLLTVMADLRKPGGCPWDQEQTHTSLKPYLLEETYEVLEHLEVENLTGLEEELGDLFLQVVFHVQIADESGNFSMAEVAKGIADKLIRRHPHIFADAKAASTEDVLINWERIKAAEKAAADPGQKTPSILDKINSYQPALMEAQEIQKKVAKVGFDWDDISGATAKVQEELNEVMEAYEAGLTDEVQAEIGDLLFSVVNVARLAGCHSELALRQTNQKVKRRFQAVERKVTEDGHRLGELSLEVLDQYWDKIKAQE